VAPGGRAESYYFLVQLGLMSGVVLNALTHPLITVASRLMAQTGTEGKKYKGPVDCIVQTVRNEGVMGLYRGITLTSIQAVIQIIIFGYVQDFGNLD